MTSRSHYFEFEYVSRSVRLRARVRADDRTALWTSRYFIESVASTQAVSLRLPAGSYLRSIRVAYAYD